MGETATTGKTILLVDDEETMRKILQRRLNAWGYAVLTAADGLEGIELANQHHPDLILLDAMMPRLNGLETCRRLKAQADTRDIPIILVTANVSELLRQQVLEAGAMACLHKPFGTEALLELIQQALGSPKLGR